jgi:hypothetical protein
MMVNAVAIDRKTRHEPAMYKDISGDRVLVCSSQRRVGARVYE